MYPRQTKKGLTVSKIYQVFLGLVLLFFFKNQLALFWGTNSLSLLGDKQLVLFERQTTFLYWRTNILSFCGTEILQLALLFWGETNWPCWGQTTCPCEEKNNLPLFVFIYGKIIWSHFTIILTYNQTRTNTNTDGVVPAFNQTAWIRDYTPVPLV